MVSGAVEVATDREEEKSMRRRKTKHNLDTLLAIVIKVHCSENICGGWSYIYCE